MTSSTPLPLEKRTIVLDSQNGLHRDVPALHKHWIVTRQWTFYKAPPDQEEGKVPGAQEAWQELARKVLGDLSWLLSVPCHVFWSQICNDNSLNRWLTDIMETFPREYDQDPSWSQSVIKSNNTILHKLFLVHVRLCTHKESSQDFFTPEFWGQMLYEKYILELPRILDMCVLFQSCNRNIVSKMVGNVLRHQPQYNNDLVECLLTINSALDSVSEQYQVLSLSQPSSHGQETLVDIVQYCVDISVTLYSLVSVHSPAADNVHTSGLDVRLAGFYTGVVTSLVTMVHRYGLAEVVSASDMAALLTSVNTARHHMVSCVRETVSQVCLLDTMTVEDRLESYFTMMTSLMAEVGFLSDYNELYPIRAEFDQFESCGIAVDSVRKHYILDMFNDTHTQSFMTSQMNEAMARQASQPAVTAVEEPVQSQGACALQQARPSAVEMVSLVSSVRDLLPHLGEGFVELVLAEYGFKVDEAINALLENNLPPHLLAMDQSLPRQEVIKEKETGAEPVFRSVYDEDEFDINNRDYIDTSKVHRGKRNKINDAKKLLEDKSDVWKMKDRFDRLGIVEDIEVVPRLAETAEHGNDYDYDDEYDDTYDDVDYGEQEPDAKDDLGREFVLPVALGGGKIKKIVEPQEHSEEEEEDDEAKKKMNFCRNPEEVRQENERKRQERLARNNKHRGGGGGHNRDVVGRAKGQGQDKQVLLNRARKNANKGKGQRVGADRKAAKGMF